MRLSIDAYERMAGNILKIYEQAEIEMTRRVANRVKRGVTQPGWTEQKYSEMKAVTRQMSKVVDSLHRDFNVQAMQYVETGYEDGRTSFINEAREFADLSQIHELTPTAIKVANIIGDLDMSMSAADRLILRQANDAYANIIGETSALIATGSFTEKQAVQIALNRFADKGISSFIDKAGRHWDMTTYAEMATLTAIERATRQGYTDTMQEFGFDLAIISSHYGACPLCEAWENVVISISGKDTRYLSLADAEAGGCFHPRCMHVFSTYYDGITRGGRDRPSPVGPANPGYAARSQQRAWERQERKWKRRMAAATTPEEERAAYARVRMYQDKIRGLVADYNNTVDPSVDYLPRKYDREGGRVKLSDSAKKLRPVQIIETRPNMKSAKAENTVGAITQSTNELTLFASAMQGASNAAEFWMNMDSNQMEAFSSSGENINDLYNRLKSSIPSEALELPEWKPDAPGGAQNYMLSHDYSHASINVQQVQARSEGWMAGAETTGVINVRNGGIDDWRYVIPHEAGHQLANYNPELQRMIVDNPGGLLGRYNQKRGFFDGAFGEYNAEEAWADAVSAYVNSPEQFAEQYPELYNAVDGFFATSPSALDFVNRAIASYRKSVGL